MQPKDWSKPPEPTPPQVIYAPRLPRESGVDPRIVAFYYVLPVLAAMFAAIAVQLVFGYRSGGVALLESIVISQVIRAFIFQRHVLRKVKFNPRVAWAATPIAFAAGLVVVPTQPRSALSDHTFRVRQRLGRERIMPLRLTSCRARGRRWVYRHLKWHPHARHARKRLAWRIKPRPKRTYGEQAGAHILLKPL